jgi:hypothetical protein
MVSLDRKMPEDGISPPKKRSLGPGNDRPRRRRSGRPAYAPTLTDRRKVEERRAAGMSVAQIAVSMRIDRQTLEKHFVEEIEFGHARRRGEVVDMLFQAARNGNVSALKALERMTDLSSAEQAWMKTAARAAEAKERTEAKPASKKQQEQVAAETAEVGTGWSDFVH